MVIPKLIDSVVIESPTGSPTGSDVTLDTSAETLAITGLGTVIPLRNLIGKPTKYTYAAGTAAQYALTFTTNPTAGDVYTLSIERLYNNPELIRSGTSELKFSVAANSTATAAALRTQFLTLIDAAIDAGQVNGTLASVTTSGASTILVVSNSADYALRFTLKGPGSGGTTIAAVADGTTVDSAATVAWVAPVGTYAQVSKWNSAALPTSTYSYVLINFRMTQPGIGTDGLELNTPVWVGVFAKSTDADTVNLLDYIVAVSTTV